ncbi:hypothetical protein FBD94_08255 [Pedobacter hiemivivus]|uniref:Uncharacterized protein n=1 Tax=Pedobacter hiemivivus TaxID=2530454 RepID=A0A4U1GEQ2_9SPHI|nr:hypothetical protein [Pedobacter hiemivivus]TKC62204.1 hypothetical protein FBD94_08255 [Pedobacter hiemivivus]
MKKLFFTALVAVVAVSGAHATSLWLDNSQGAADFICDGGIPDCSAKFGSQTVYTQPGASGSQGTSTQISIYNYSL